MKRIIFTLLFFLNFYALYAQSSNDPTITYSQEECQLTTSELQRFICYVTRANIEEKTLLKIGIRPNSLSPLFTDNKNVSLGLNLELVAEHKISPSFSVLAGLDYVPQYNSVRIYSNAKPGAGRTMRSFSNQVKARFGGRYYYAMARRIREGKTANNFSGNYVGLQVDRPVIYQYTQHDYDTPTGEPITTRNHIPLFRLNQPSVELTWGLQRRLWRLGYIDVSAGPRMTFIGESSIPAVYEKYTVFSFQFNALIGIGW
ncbi:hypothetical protein [Larkinella knui]|uniref:Outer membrane protein beta-barrel domain-containing protein n=1 Tax=Larkinella knui TaxID=2025310 RepID=A0A3P1CIU3_9BACT|nr:hypothetical protein [Larkinella knui]RRB12814.1 hypothetical protein EHT87_21800 [Larkinella knui]